MRFYCSITYDPFRFLTINKKVYGFVITIKETPNTIPTLFKTIESYKDKAGLSPGPGMWDFMVERKSGRAEYSELSSSSSSP